MSNSQNDRRKTTSKQTIIKARETRKRNQEEKFKLLSEINENEKLIIEKYGINTYITRRLNNLETMILGLSKKFNRIIELKESEIDNSKLMDIILLLKEINIRLDYKEKDKKKEYKPSKNALNDELNRMKNKYL